MLGRGNSFCRWTSPTCAVRLQRCCRERADPIRRWRSGRERTCCLVFSNKTWPTVLSFVVCGEFSGQFLCQPITLVHPTSDRSPLLSTRLCSITDEGRTKWFHVEVAPRISFRSDSSLGLRSHCEQKSPGLWSTLNPLLHKTIAEIHPNKERDLSFKCLLWTLLKVKNQWRLPWYILMIYVRGPTTVIFPIYCWLWYSIVVGFFKLWCSLQSCVQQQF